jgi:hypothetical protein
MLELSAESRIREAVESGYLDNLPNAGKPIETLETPADVWLMIRFNQRRRMRDALNEMDAALDLEWKLRHILALTDEEAARMQVDLLNARIREMNAVRHEQGEAPIASIHVDSVMAQWRDLHRPR